VAEIREASQVGVSSQPGPAEQVPLSGTREAFRIALLEEIKAASGAAADAAVPLVNGRRIAGHASSSQYLFSATSALNVPTDAPGELLIPGRDPVEVVVISVQGMDVTVSVPMDLGEWVAEARLKSDLAFLLKRLIARIEETESEPNAHGDRILNGGPAAGEPVAIDDPVLNDTQDAALGSAIGRNLTFIWGPPGTGKTQTIGAIGEQLYRRGRSVLLVSHTNTAVDQALLKIADQLGGELEAGELLRLGEPVVQRLREREDLLLDSAVRQRQRQLHERRDQLLAEKEICEERIASCKVAIALLNWAAGVPATLAQLRSELAATERATDRIEQLRHELDAAAADEEKVRRAAGEVELAATRDREASEARQELERLADANQALLDRIVLAEGAVWAASEDLEKAQELSASFERECALPPLEDQRAAVDRLADPVAAANQDATSTEALLQEAEALLDTTEKANAVTRRLRRLPKPEEQVAVVQKHRGETAAAQARAQALDHRLQEQAAVLAELEELDAQLGRWRHVANPEGQEALLADRGQQLEGLREEANELSDRQRQTERTLAALAESVAEFRRDHGRTHEEALTGIRPQLERFDALRDELSANERAEAESMRRLTEGLEEQLQKARAAGLRTETTDGADVRELLRRLEVAAAEAGQRAASLDSGLLTQEIDEHQQHIHLVEGELGSIEEELEAARRSAIQDAAVVATTLTRAYLWDEVQERRFDTVILDEASMAPIPALWAVARLAETNVVIVGDFLQLPPIKRADHPLAEKWLGRDIFDVSGMQKAWEDGAPPPHFVQLNEQYRMHPEISSIPNKLIYKDTLRDHPSASEVRGLTGWYNRDWGQDTPVLLVDTGGSNAWVSSVAAGGRNSRLNFVSAVVSVSLANQMIRDDAPEVPVGAQPRILIATPYRAQAKLLQLLIADAGLDRAVEPGTAHAFQGSEAPVVIFDLTIDDPHWRVALCVPKYDKTNKQLLNVALTRPQDRLVVVGDFDYIERIGKRSFLGDTLVPFLTARYPKVDADEVAPADIGAGPAQAQALLAGGQVEPRHQREVMTQAEVFPRLYTDLDRASERIVIYSPFITQSRLAEVLPHLSAAVARGVRVYLITKALDDRGKRDGETYRRAEEQLERVGATVIHKPGMHEKLVFVDGEIAWAGSLNVLSFRNTQEWMARWKSRDVVEDFSRPLALERILSLYESDDARCPVCGSELVPAEGLSGVYWRCSVKGCYSQDLDKPLPRDGMLRCASLGCDGAVEFYDSGKRPVWRCTSNRRHRQSVHPNHLRLPKMRDLVVERGGVRGLRKISRELGTTVQLPSVADRHANTVGADGVVTAVELAQRLGQDPRTFRAWLRAKGRDGHPILARHRLNEPWGFTPEEADQIAKEYIKR